MYQNRSKLQSGSESNINNKVKEVKTTTTTTVIQTKIEKPKNDYGKLPQASGRSSAVYTIKTNINNVQNKKPNLNDNVSEASSKNADKPKYRWSVANHRFELENPTTTTTTTTTTTNYVKTKNKEEKKPEVKSVTNISTSYSTNYGANKYSVTKKEAAPNVSTTVIRSTSKKDDKKNKPLTTQSKVVKEEVKIVETKKDYIPKIPETKVVKQEVKVVETKKDYAPKVPETKVVKEEVKIVETKKDTPIVGAISKYIVNTKKDDGKTTTNNVYNVKTYERKTDNKNNILDKDKNSTVKEVKVTYNYNRDKLGIKTDEDLPQRKNKYKEEVKIEPKKRTTLTTTYTSYTPNPRKSEDKSVKKVVEVKKTQINNINNVNSNVYKAPVNTRVVEKVEKKVEQIPYVPDQREEVNRIEIEEEVDQNGENLDYVDQKEKENRLKIALNEIERVNAEKTLKDEDLIELFEKVLEYNREFKDDIFFKNLNDTHRKVGGMDKVDRRKIPHTFKEIETSKILKNHENAKDLLKKYTYRAKRIVEED